MMCCEQAMNPYSIDLRQKIIDTYYNTPSSQRQLAQRFCVALSFVQKLLKQYRQTGTIAPKPHRGGGQLKLTSEQLAILAELIETNNDATLKELCHLLHEKTGVMVSIATMGRMTQRLNITLKKKTLFPSEKGSERVQNLRYEFWEKVRDINVSDLIFIDEAGVNLGMVRLYARSLCGTRARGERPHHRGKNVSIIGAISLKKIVTSINLVGGIDRVTFEAFIIKKLVPHLWKGACVVMDNYSIHKGEEIEKAIAAVGARVIYLSPYSPDLSPIENFWSKVKSILRSLGARTYQALDDAISEAFSRVDSQDLSDWFTHCCYCTSST